MRLGMSIFERLHEGIGGSLLCTPDHRPPPATTALPVASLPCARAGPEMSKSTPQNGSLVLLSQSRISNSCCHYIRKALRVN